MNTKTFQIEEEISQDAKGFAARTIKAILYGSVEPHSIGVNRKISEPKEIDDMDDNSDIIAENFQVYSNRD